MGVHRQPRGLKIIDVLHQRQGLPPLRLNPRLL